MFTTVALLTAVLSGPGQARVSLASPPATRLRAPAARPERQTCLGFGVQLGFGPDGFGGGFGRRWGPLLFRQSQIIEQQNFENRRILLQLLLLRRQRQLYGNGGWGGGWGGDISFRFRGGSPIGLGYGDGGGYGDFDGGLGLLEGGGYGGLDGGLPYGNGGGGFCPDCPSTPGGPSSPPALPPGYRAPGGGAPPGLLMPGAGSGGPGGWAPPGYSGPPPGTIGAGPGPGPSPGGYMRYTSTALYPARR